VNRGLASASALVAVALALLGTATVASGGVRSTRTTAPQAIRLDSVVLGDKQITFAFTRVPRGDVVVFKVHNGSSHRARFLIVPRTVLSDPGQGGSGFKTKLLEPGALTSFQVLFSSRGSFDYRLVDGAGKIRVKGRFFVI
jgi:hypothetical protein